MRTKERILYDLVFDHSRVTDPIERLIINFKFILEVLIDIRDVLKDLFRLAAVKAGNPDIT